MGKNRQQSGTSPVGLDSGSIKRDSGFVSGPGDGAAAKHQRASIISAASLSMTNDRQKRETKSPPRAAVHPLTRRAKNPNLEEAARQHAEERLSKLGYGRERPSTTRLRSMSVNSVRLRADQIDREARMRDDEESERSAQRKRGYDALLLMSTARKNVQSRLSEQDRQMADSRGIYYREDWHQKATEIAQSKHDQREAPPEGVDIGGGAFMSQEEINAIAERKVKPVIDDMNEKSGEYHQSRKDRREAKARELATKLNRDKEKRFLGRKRRSGAPEAESPTGIYTNNPRILNMALTGPQSKRCQQSSLETRSYARLSHLRLRLPISNLPQFNRN